MSFREIDGHKLHLYPKEVARVLRGDLDNSLLQVEIGLTNACNHRCNYCSLSWIKRQADYIHSDILIESFSDMNRLGCRSVYFAGEGEPLLHPDIKPILFWAKERIGKVSLSTNGALLKNEYLNELDWIRIGLDACTKETYKLIHSRDDFDKVVENIKKAVEYKHKHNLEIDIGVQALLLPENEKEITLMAVLLRNIGVDNFQVKPFHNQPLAPKRSGVDYRYIDWKEELTSLTTDKFRIIFREKSMERMLAGKDYKNCLGLHFWTLIDAKGNVLPCNVFMENPDFYYGNIYEKSFSEIWASQRRKYIIQKIRPCVSYTCRPDLLNRYIWRLKNPERNDEFI